MRQDHYNVGLHTLDSLATIVSIGLEISAKLYRPFFTSLTGSRMDLTFFRESSKHICKDPFQKSQNIVTMISFS